MQRIPLFAVLAVLAAGCATDPSMPNAATETAAAPCARSAQVPGAPDTPTGRKAPEERPCDADAGSRDATAQVEPANPPVFAPSLSLFRGWSFF